VEAALLLPKAWKNAPSAAEGDRGQVLGADRVTVRRQHGANDGD
jgi:hypothetical protein